MATKSTFVQALLIGALALVPAIGQAIYWRNRVTWSQPSSADEITVAEAKAIHGPVLWLDARAASDFASAHVPQAMNLNAEQWDAQLPAALGQWQPGMKVIVYCSSKECNASREVARRLREEAQLQNVFVLKGGWEAWQSGAR
ncbi:MAG: rhodanese-like domain-containing protein [Verrucomicrobiota bacterium]|nr:rhodanese-like domain-containing protein [Verrucomicrobiota bacterium]